MPSRLFREALLVARPPGGRSISNLVDRCTLETTMRELMGVVGGGGGVA